MRDGDKLSFDQAAIEAANVGVADGRLAITARREEVRGRPFTTGYLDTIGRFAQRYGRWEARVRLPVAHGEGRFLASDDTLRMLEAEGRVVLRYVAETEGSPWQPNPNGSAAHIAGIRNAAGNVVGIMPHPERADEPVLGLSDGRRFFTSMAAWTPQPATEKVSKR